MFAKLKQPILILVLELVRHRSQPPLRCSLLLGLYLRLMSKSLMGTFERELTAFPMLSEWFPMSGPELSCLLVPLTVASSLLLIIVDLGHSSCSISSW